MLYPAYLWVFEVHSWRRFDDFWPFLIEIRLQQYRNFRETIVKLQGVWGFFEVCDMKIQECMTFWGVAYYNQWQNDRTKKDGSIDLITDPYQYAKKGDYRIIVKVIDIFGNDTTHIIDLQHR